MPNKTITIIDGGDSSVGINSAEATIDLSQWYDLENDELESFKKEILKVFIRYGETTPKLYEPPQEVSNSHIKSLVEDTFKSIRQEI